MAQRKRAPMTPKGQAHTLTSRGTYRSDHVIHQWWTHVATSFWVLGARPCLTIHRMPSCMARSHSSSQLAGDGSVVSWWHRTVSLVGNGLGDREAVSSLGSWSAIVSYKYAAFVNKQCSLERAHLNANNSFNMPSSDQSTHTSTHSIASAVHPVSKLCRAS